MNTGNRFIAPLPLRIEPLPWEDLYSFLSRSAKHMQYASATWILQPETSPYHIDPCEVSLLSEQADYTFLSQLLSITEETVYQMTLHPFLPLLQPLHFFLTFKKGYWSTERHITQRITSSSSASFPHALMDKQLRLLFFLPNQTTQICPLCLNEPITYDRLYWKSRYLLTCPRHGLHLQRYCSVCHKRIPSLRLRPTHCPFCRSHYQGSSSLSTIPSEELSFLLYGDLLTLQALGVKDTTLHPSFAPAPHDPRAPFSPALYFALLRAICLSLHPFQNAHFKTFLPPTTYDFLMPKSPPLPERVPSLHVAIAHWIFADWPIHFFAFLDALDYHFGRTKKKHAFYSFPDRFLLSSQAKDPHDLLSQAYRQYQTTCSFSTREVRIRERLAAFDPPTSP